MKHTKHLSVIMFLVISLSSFLNFFFLADCMADVPDMKVNSDSALELHNMSQIWVSPVDSNLVMIVWRDFRLETRRVALGVSYDQGHTWVDSLLSIEEEYLHNEPVICGDRLGNFYTMAKRFTEIPNWYDFDVWGTTDNGANWSGPFQVLNGSTEFQESRGKLAIDRTGGSYDGNLYISWTHFPNPTSIMFARSTDGGVNWEEPLLIAGPDTNNWGAGHYSKPVVDADGNVYVIWAGWEEIEGDPQRFQKMVKSLDGGLSFSDPVVICPSYYVNEAPGSIIITNLPGLDADLTNGPYSGNIYLAVPCATTMEYNSPSDIIFSRSTDGGDTWSSPIRINDDPEGPPVYQFHPSFTVNQDGVIIIFFSDQRNDPPYYENYDSYIAFSFDGGETFTTNYRVSDVSSIPGVCPSGERGLELPIKTFEQLSSDQDPVTYLQCIMCTYIGVSAYYDRVHCTWTDTRDGGIQNIYYSNFLIPLLPPRILMPEDSIYFSDTLVQSDFHWAACGFFDEVHYNLEISIDSNFAAIDLIYADIDTNIFLLSSSFNETTYFWRVKAFKVADTSESQYSIFHSFTVDTTSPGIPTLFSPADSSTITDTMPEFAWSDISPLSPGLSGAPIFYSLQISSDSDFTPGPELVEYTDLYTTSLDIPDPLPDYQTYYWRVKAIDEAGNQGEWQDQPFWFRVQVYLYGDANGDGEVTIGDAVYLVNYLFKDGRLPAGSYTGDVNCDGTTAVEDIVYLVNYLFRDGPEPCSE